MAINAQARDGNIKLSVSQTNGVVLKAYRRGVSRELL